MIKVYMFIIIMGIIGSVGYGGYIYYKDTQARIQTLAENSAKLEQAAELQNNTIATLEADAKKYAELNNQLQAKLVSANKYKNELLGKLRKINLSKVSAEEPAVWERKINNASKKVLESFESITAYPSSK